MLFNFLFSGQLTIFGGGSNWTEQTTGKIMETYVEELRIWKPSILPLSWNLQTMVKLPCP
jgi:hypothetical protein